jgi:1-deoxy-D-xylulose-5-phosphate synthase
MKDLVKYMVVPECCSKNWDSLLGPIDGHNLDDMIAVFQKARRMKGPVLIHVMTQKGQGYGPAFDNPDEFHGIGPFDISTGMPLKGKSRTYTQVFGDYMVKKAAQMPNLVAITAAMTSGTGLERFAEIYPERFFEVGIC